MSRRKLSRNALCPCGSGKKYKRCCFHKDFDWIEDDEGNIFKSIPFEWNAAIEEYEAEHGSTERPEFPVGTVALYGPDDETTTKIVAGVIAEPNAEAIVERWVGTDVTENPKVRKGIEEFFAEHGVKSVIATDKNMGCPHEEGKDFPLGEDCPFCPYWKGQQGSGALF